MQFEALTYLPSSPSSPSPLGLLVGESLTFTVHNLPTSIEFRAGQCKVPVTTAVPLTGDSAKTILPLCYVYFVQRTGLVIGIRARGGGCCASKDSIARNKRASVRCTKETTPSVTQRPSDPQIGNEEGQYPGDIVPFLKEKKEPPPKSYSDFISKYCLDSLALLHTGSIHTVDITALEGFPQVWVGSPRAVAWTLVEILTHRSVWSNKDLGLFRNSAARMAAKNFVDMIFSEAENFYIVPGDKGKQKIANLMSIAKEMDEDGATLCEIEFINELFQVQKNAPQINHWMLKVERDVSYLFDSYSTTACHLPPVEFAVTKRSIESFIGQNHELELHLALDAIYCAIGGSHIKKGNPLVAGAVTYLFQLFQFDFGQKSWRCYYYPLSCLDWAIRRDKIAATLIAQVQLKLDTLCEHVEATLQENAQKVINKAQRVKGNLYSFMLKK